MIRRVEDGEGHRYETETGEPVPGVTTVINRSIDKPALVPWASNLTAAYAVNNWEPLTALPPADRLETIKKEWRGVRDRAADRGTTVHAYGEALAHGKDVDVPEDLVAYVEPYARLLDLWQIEPAYVECVVYSDQPAYAGTLDLIAEVGDRGRWLLDIKTAGSGIYRETSLQLAAYRWADWIIHAGKAIPMVDVDRTAVVWLRGDGTAKLIPICSDSETYQTFRHLVPVARWMTGRKPSSLVGRPLTDPVRSKDPA